MQPLNAVPYRCRYLDFACSIFCSMPDRREKRNLPTFPRVTKDQVKAKVVWQLRIHAAGGVDQSNAEKLATSVLELRQHVGSVQQIAMSASGVCGLPRDGRVLEEAVDLRRYP